MLNYIKFLIDTQRNEPALYWLNNIARWIVATWTIRNDFSDYQWGDWLNW